MSAAASPTAALSEKEREALLVDRGFQLRALLPVIVFAGLYAVLLAGALFIRLYPAVAAEPDPGIRAILGAQLVNVQLHIWPLLAVGAMLAIYFNLRWSLKVVRPAYRMHYALKELIEGEAKPVRFLPGEEFRFFEDDLAQLSQKIKLIGTRNRDILLAVHAQVRRLADRLAADQIMARADLEEFTRGVLTQLEKAPEIGLPARR